MVLSITNLARPRQTRRTRRNYYGVGVGRRCSGHGTSWRQDAVSCFVGPAPSQGTLKIDALMKRFQAWFHRSGGWTVRSACLSTPLSMMCHRTRPESWISLAYCRPDGIVLTRTVAAFPLLGPTHCCNTAHTVRNTTVWRTERLR